MNCILKASASAEARDAVDSKNISICFADFAVPKIGSVILKLC